MRPDDTLGYDPHCYMEPEAMLTPSRPGTTVNRRGLDRYGAIVWLHGPEPLGRRGGKRWAVRVMTLGGVNRNHVPRSYVWNGGCNICKTEADALALFRRMVGAP